MRYLSVSWGVGSVTWTVTERALMSEMAITGRGAGRKALKQINEVHKDFLFFWYFWSKETACYYETTRYYGCTEASGGLCIYSFLLSTPLNQKSGYNYYWKKNGEIEICNQNLPFLQLCLWYKSLKPESSHPTLFLSPHKMPHPKHREFHRDFRRNVIFLRSTNVYKYCQLAPNWTKCHTEWNASATVCVTEIRNARIGYDVK